MKLLTLARDLQRRKGRERQGCFVAEGVRTVEALLASPITPVGLLITADVRETDRGLALTALALASGLEMHEVSAGEFASAASTDSPQGILAVAEIPASTLRAPVAATGRYLLLDALQDPGNVGTIIRTAAAFGVTATVALPGTVDVWNAKVVRSAMGALFIHPVVTTSWESVQGFLEAHAITCWAADTDGIDVRTLHSSLDHTVPAQLAIVVSNEGSGLSAPIGAVARQRVAISMASGVESLNVAVAAGILLHALQGV